MSKQQENKWGKVFIAELNTIRKQISGQNLKQIRADVGKQFRLRKNDFKLSIAEGQIPIYKEQDFEDILTQIESTEVVLRVKLNANGTPKPIVLSVGQVSWARKFTAKHKDEKKTLDGQTFEELMADTSTKFQLPQADFTLTTVICAKGEKREYKLTKKIFDAILPSLP